MDAINWHGCFFLLFALTACGFAVAVVVSSNIVRMAFYLVLSLGSVAGLFFLAGAEFVGALQLIIYVGGTLVLLIFGVMLTGSGPFVSMKIDWRQWLVASVAGMGLLAVLLVAAWKVSAWEPTAAVPTDVAQAASPTAGQLGMALLGIRDQDGLAGYLLPFEIVSVHLLVVLIGAAFLARSRRRRPQSTETVENAKPEEPVEP